MELQAATQQGRSLVETSYSCTCSTPNTQ